MKNIAKIISLIAIGLTLSSPAIAQAEAEPFVLASGGYAQAVIVPQNGGNTNGISYAANELAKYLGKISGAHFMVATKPVPGYKTILVGTPYKASKPHELSIRVKDKNTLELTGDGALGTCYAVYDLIETFGVVFSATDYEYVPSKRELSIAGDYAKVDAPYMEWRDAWCEVQYWHFEQMMKLRLPPPPNQRWQNLFGGRARPNMGQTMTTGYVSRRKFSKTHPEWYAYVHKTGQRNFHWVCVSNTNMFNQLFLEIENELKARPDTFEIAVGVDDSSSFCECPDCLELVQKYPDPDGTAVPAMQWVYLANKVGEHLYEKYPHVRVNFLGYGDRLPANPAMKLGPNVGAGLAELWRNHGLPADNNERSAVSLGNAARLSNSTHGPYIWDYLANFADYVIPFPNHRIFSQTVRYYKSCGVKGVNSQNQFASIIGDMAQMNLWIYAKLLWNPDLNIDELTRKYVNATYGKGARFILEYLNILEHSRLRQRWTWYGCYVGDTSHYLTADDCVKIYRALDNAARAELRNPMARRVRITSLAMALARYNDMIEPAKRMKVNLPSRDTLYTEWNALLSAEFARGACGAIGEGRYLDLFNRRFKGSFKSPAEPTVYPRRSSVIVAPASKLTGGSRMVKGKDPDGTEYARFKINFRGELESYWMNPSFAEAGYTIEDEDAGWWYVFATVRVSSTVDLDTAAAYIGVYQPWYINDYKCADIQEIANQMVQGRKGDTSWRTLCLGKRRLYKGSRIWLMPGVLHPCDYYDMKEVILVDPALIEKGQSAR